MNFPPFSKRLNIELTNHCNQRCPLCPRLGLTRPLGFLDLEVFKRIVNECAEHDTQFWLHFLGEPLLHRHAMEMIRLAATAGIREIGMSTNAVALGTYTRSLVESGLDRLECSMDAMDRQSYERMRGRDHFLKASENVRNFLLHKRERGRGPITSIQFMRTAELEKQLPSIIADWKPLLGPDDFLMTIEPVTFRGAIDLGKDSEADSNPGREPCSYLSKSMLILQDGTVTMCGADWDAQAPIGHIEQSSIAEIWNSSEMNRRRKAHDEGDFGDVSVCASCEDWRLSDGTGYINVISG